jgi:hypothetical protein
VEGSSYSSFSSRSLRCSNCFSNYCNVLRCRICMIMGYLGYVYVESKSFEVRSDVRGGVRLEERSKGVSRSVIIAWPTIF